MSSLSTLRRSATDAKVAGLCGGVAEHWRIDPVLVRVAWALLALSGGVGIVLYVAGWLLVPVEGQSRTAADEALGMSTRRWPKELWIALVVIACLAMSNVFDEVVPFGVAPAIVLAAIWYFGFVRRRPPRLPGAAHPGQPGAHATGQQVAHAGLPYAGATAAGPPPTPEFVAHPGPATPFTEAAGSWRRRIEEHVQRSHWPPAPSAPPSPAPEFWPVLPGPGAGAGRDPAGPQDPQPAENLELAARSAFLAQPDPVGLYAPATTPVAALPVPARDRLSARRLRLVSLAVLGLAMTGLGVTDRWFVPVPVAAYAATALLVLGLTLVAATWLGRARGLLPVALLLLPVALVAGLAGPGTELPRWYSDGRTYSAVAQFPPGGDRQEGGELVVDLTRLKTDVDASYTAHVGNGRLEVRTPPNTNVVIDYAVGLGVAEAYGRELSAGSGLMDTIPPDPVLSGRPTLTLHLSVDRGQLEVR